MAWVASHISPSRSAYEFVNEYQQIPASSTLNWVGNHSIGITFKPKQGQTDYALFHKGDPTDNPELNSLENTAYCFIRNGYLHLRLFFTSNLNLYVKTTNQDLQTDNVTHVEYTFNDTTNELLIYVNGVSVQYDIIVGAGQYSTLTAIGSAILYNSATTLFTFGYSLNDPQFEGIIYDAYLYRKTRSGVEVNSTYNIVRDPSISSGGEKILFASTRLNIGTYDYYSANNKLQNITAFKSGMNTLYDLKGLYSSNPAINNTKIAYCETNVGFYVANRDGGTPFLVAKNSNDLLCPTFKSDGTTIFWIQFTSTTNSYAIFKGTLNLVTNAVTVPTIVKSDGLFQYLSLDVSPDGLKIVARKIDSSGFEFLVIMDIDGTNELILNSFSNLEDIYYPRFNRQNTMIVFSRRVNTSLGYKYKIFTMTNTGGTLRQIDGDPSDCLAWSFSPDGLNIAYTNSGNQWAYDSCFTMDINGRNKRNVSTYNSYFDKQPEWLVT
jgi:Tol biopolymer transport system component